MKFNACPFCSKEANPNCTFNADAHILTKLASAYSLWVYKFNEYYYNLLLREHGNTVYIYRFIKNGVKSNMGALVMSFDLHEEIDFNSFPVFIKQLEERIETYLLFL
jgi:hypothetical protein